MNNEPGCDCPPCQEVVCALDSFCCTNMIRLAAVTHASSIRQQCDDRRHGGYAVGEGSYGVDGDGLERAPNLGACLPQSLGGCP